jgi:hypothetical protein
MPLGAKGGRRPGASLLRWFASLLARYADFYHPERHYMRGSGPKSRQKQRS